MMAWILIAIAAITLWATLCSSCVPAKPAFLSTGSAKTGKKRNVLLVVAHPDDKSMFFAPIIPFLASEGHSLHILCLSTGNADRKGNVCTEELYRACAVLKVPLKQVKILEHLNLQDGLDNPWDHQLIATIVEEEIKMRGLTQYLVLIELMRALSVSSVLIRIPFKSHCRPSKSLQCSSWNMHAPT